MDDHNSFFGEENSPLAIFSQVKNTLEEVGVSWFKGPQIKRHLNEHKLNVFTARRKPLVTLEN